MSDARPEAYDGFEGEVGRIFSTSESWWPPRPTPPDQAPNVIVMLVDDVGFADLGCYGSEIPTPHLDRLADDGVRYSNFHVNPMCSPTRASLLTGLNHHLAGVGHVAHADPGYPGYAMEIREDAVTLAEAFRANGYATQMIGKWHLCKDSDLSDAAPKHSWPLQRGFDRFYGILDGFTNFHQPHRLYEDNHVVEVDRYPDGYYFTDDLTDRAIAMIRSHRSSDPHKPFFQYFAHGAAHAPLQAKAEDIERHRGDYDVGWDAIRERRFARQKELGVIAADTELPPRNHEPGHAVKAWDELSADEQRLFARYQEIYAAMITSIDQSVGRLRAALEEIGEWDNTIVVFTSDNGGSAEGDEIGTSAYFQTLLAKARFDSGQDIATDLERFDKLGGPETLPHYPLGWSQASNTPFRLYKINTHQGGHQVPLIISWPTGLADHGGAVRTPYQHVTDLMPTLGALTGIDIPDERHGRIGPERAGASFADSLSDGDAASTHPEQYYEQWGHRGYYRDGWSAVTCHQDATAFADDHWELHDLVADPSETTDLSAGHPDKVAELADAWEQAAWANQVFPIDERSKLKEVTRPPGDERLAEPIEVVPGTPTLERYRSLQLIFMRSCRITAPIDYASGDEGVLFAHGDQGGGYSVYLEDGRLFLAYNAYGTLHTVDGGELAEGSRTVTLDLVAPGSLRWHVDLRADGESVGRLDDVPMLMAMAPFQGIDVGIDRRSPVSWPVYERHGPFPYSGTLDPVRWEPGEPAPDAPAQFMDLMREVARGYE